MRLRKFHISQAIVFILTFFSYALLHANRKSFSNVKPTLRAVWTATKNNYTNIYPSNIWNTHNLFSTESEAKVFLGILDTVFMAFYALGLFIMGYIGDRLDPRIVLSIGMVSSATVLFFFGVVTEWLHFYNKYLYGFLFALNGISQSTGWPATVTIMSNWFGESRGFWLGLWSGCACVGNIVGDLLTGSVVEYGYDYGFLIPVAVLLTFGIISGVGLLSHPDELGSKHPNRRMIQTNDEVPIYSDESSSVGSVSLGSTVLPKKSRIGLKQIMRIPGVIPYSLAYASLKFVNYAFFFWLPEYLASSFQWSNALADKISIWYDVGGILGGIVTGIISDLMWSRSPITIASLIVTIPALVLYRQAPDDITSNSFYLAFTGFVIGGPATLISSAISADLGSEPLLSGNEAALSTVTGIVDGTGSIGAALGQVFVPIISNQFGWQAVFVFFMVMISVTVLCIAPVLIRDILNRIKRGRRGATDYSILSQDESSTGYRVAANSNGSRETCDD